MAKSSTDYRVTLGVESKAYKQAMREVNRENKEFKRQARESFKQAKLDAQDGFGGVIAMAKKFAPAISAGAAALKVAQTALKENQRFTDEWARVTESAKASYESFVDALVHADFSGFFSQIDDVVRAARAAADALDALDTGYIFSNKELADLNLAAAQYRFTLKSKTSTEADKTAARKGLIDVRDRQMGVAQTLSDRNLVTFADLLVSRLTNKGAHVTRADFIRQGEKGLELVEGGKYEKYLGYLSNYEATIDRFMRFEDDFSRIKNWQKVGYVTDKETGETIGLSEYEDLRAFADISDDKLREAFDYYIKSRQEIQKIVELMTSDTRYVSGGGKGTGGSASSAKVYAEGSIGWMEQQIAKYQERLKSATSQLDIDQANYWIKRYERDIEAMRNASNNVTSYNISGGIAISDKYGKWGEFRKANLKPFATTPIEQVEEEVEVSKDLTKTAKYAADGLALVSDTLQTLGITAEIQNEPLSKALRIIGSVIRMVGSNIGGPLGSAISIGGSIIGSFSGGGIVGGTSYTGDRLTARVNSGEMILTAAQQGQLFQMLNGGGTGGGNLLLRGEDLYGSIRNYGRRTGKIYLP